VNTLTGTSKIFDGPESEFEFEEEDDLLDEVDDFDVEFLTGALDIDFEEEEPKEPAEDDNDEELEAERVVPSAVNIADIAW
jgi:hypothetical protein